MDSAGTATAPPVTYPVFGAVALGITGRSVYDVIEQVGGMFESVGAVFEGSPDAPGTLIALLPPSEDAAIRAARMALQAQAVAPALRIGVDATQVRAKKEQDARWQQVIDSAVRLQKAARTGESIAGDAIRDLSAGGAATQALAVGEETFLLLTGVSDEVAAPRAVPTAAVAPAVPMPEPAAAPAEAEPLPPQTARAPGQPQTAPDVTPVAADDPEPVPIPVLEQPVADSPSSEVQPNAGTAAGGAPPVMNPAVRFAGPLIGREQQLADLRGRFDRVVTDRAAACVVVTGEPGVGRTRLAEELLQTSGADVRRFRVGCLPVDDGGARWPLAALIEACTDVSPTDPPAQVQERLAAHLADAPDAERLISELLAMQALDGRLQTDDVRWAIRRLLEVSVGDEPTILVIEDADRPGAGFIRLLADVVAVMRDSALLVVLTAVRESEAVPAIRLAPLPPTEAAALVRSLLGAVDPGVDDAIAARTSGSPFDIEQTLAVLTETGALAPGQGTWMPLADMRSVPLPDGPTGLVRRRLQTLHPHALAVLGMAAVVGEIVQPASLLEIIPPDARGTMPGHLTTLVDRGLLVDVGDGEYRFRHALVRAATTGGVPAWAQAMAHLRVARDLEIGAGDRLWRVADRVGGHLAAACARTPDPPTSDRDDALELLTWAAAAAVEHGDLDGAARLEYLSASLVDHDPVRRAELLYLAAEHGATAAPERPADREIAEAALAASVAGDDVDWRVRLLRARLRTTAGHEDALEGARATADDAIAAFDDDALSWALASAWALRGLVHAARAQNGMVADDLARAADNAAAAGRWREETAALRGAAAALLDGPAGVEDAEARCRGFLGRVRGPLAEHDLRGAIALLQARRAAFDEARATIAGSAAALEELGAAADLAVLLRRSAEIETLAGEGPAAELQMQRAMAAVTNARDERLRAEIAGAFAHLLAADDDRLDEALALADVAETHAGGIAAQVAWRMARARVMVRRGRGAHAERLVREGLSLAEQTDSTDLRANTLVHTGDVRRFAGRPAEAEPFERRALRLFERRGATAQADAVRAVVRPAETPEPMEDPPTHTAEPSGPTAADPGPERASHDAGYTVADDLMALTMATPDPERGRWSRTRVRLHRDALPGIHARRGGRVAASLVQPLTGGGGTSSSGGVGGPTGAPGTMSATDRCLPDSVSTLSTTASRAFFADPMPLSLPPPPANVFIRVAASPSSEPPLLPVTSTSGTTVT